MAGRNVVLAVALVIGLGLAGPTGARAYDPQVVEQNAAAENDAADPSVGAEAEPAEEPSEEYMEGDFCGGGETPVDEAWSVMRDGQLRKADRMVRRGLRDGTIERWAQAGAYSLLGEIALRRGRARAAIGSYRHALRIDEEEAGLGARVGLAVALYRIGDVSGAVTEAERVADTCRNERYADEVACYGAYHVIGLASEDADQMLEAMHAALVIEADTSEGNASELAELRERVTPTPPTRSARSGRGARAAATQSNGARRAARAALGTSTSTSASTSTSTASSTVATGTVALAQ